MSEKAIEIKGLTKIYNGSPAVNSLNLEIDKGSIFSFLGPNGAGKTTTIKMLLGLIYPDGGEGKILGYDIGKGSIKIRENIGYVSETQNLYDYMTVKEIIAFTQGAYPKWDEKIVKKYLDLFELSINRKVKALSKGMRTQLGLILALGPQPELLILDEPTSGLDPIKQKEFLKTIVEQVVETGQTVFFSSHHLWEAERLADRVGIISKGKMVLDRDMDDLKANHKKIKFSLNDKLHDIIKSIPGVVQISEQGKGYILSVVDNFEEIYLAVQALEPLTCEVINESLEDIFMYYAGRE